MKLIAALFPFLFFGMLQGILQEAIEPIDSSNADTLMKIWEVQTSDQAVLSQPVIEEGIVYTGDLKGNVYAIDALSGAVIWKTCIEDESFASSPILNPYSLFIAGSRLYSLDLKTGKLQWSAFLYDKEEGAAPLPAPILGVNGKIICGVTPTRKLGNSHLVCFDMNSGKVKWRFFPPEMKNENGVWSEMAYDEIRKALFVAIYHEESPELDKLYSIDFLKGKNLWSYNLSSNPSPSSTAPIEPLPASTPLLLTTNHKKSFIDLVGVGSRDGHYRIFFRNQPDPMNVEPVADMRFQKATCFGAACDLNENLLYLAATDCQNPIFPWIHIYAIDLKKLFLMDNIKGLLPQYSVKWKNSVQGNGSSYTPLCVNETLFHTSSTGYIRALNTATGKELWRYKTEGISIIGSNPIYTEGQLYFRCTKGIIAYKLYRDIGESP